MSNMNVLEQSIPVAPLGLVSMDSTMHMIQNIDKNLAQYRRSTYHMFKNEPALKDYVSDSYIINASCPRFSSGEAKAMFHDSIRGLDIYILCDVTNHSITYTMNGYTNHKSPDDHFQDLKRIISAASGFAHRINVIMPFLYGGRQHHKNARESLDCAIMLDELANMGISNFITFDAHDPRVANAIPLIGFDNYIPPYQFIKALMQSERDLIIDKDHIIVISPDEGAVDRTLYFANVIGVGTGMFYKRRDYSTIIDGKNPIVSHEFLGSNIEGKDVIIIDDMISSGDSMIDTARMLKQMNAGRVYICTTFGLFTNGLKSFDEAYEKCYFDKLITANLNYMNPDIKQKPYYIEADMTDFLSYIVDYMNHDAAMSHIETPTEKIQQILKQYNDRDESIIY